MEPEVLSRRALNRALLARQRLLRRVPAAGPAANPAGGPAGAAETGRPRGPGGPGDAGPVIETIEHLVGMQAQAPFPPARDRDEITTEATRVLAFAAPRAAFREVRFAPVGATGAG